MTEGASVTLDSLVASEMTNRRRANALKSLGVITLRDALTYYPFRVTDPVPVRPIRQTKLGEPSAFAGRVEGIRVVPLSGRRGYRLDVAVNDEESARAYGGAAALARLVFFSHRKSYVDWMAMRLRTGVTVVVAGEPTTYMDQLQFTHPETLVVAGDEGSDGSGLTGPASGSVRPDADSVQAALARVCRPRPVYHANSRISSDHIHDSILGFIRLLSASHGSGIRDSAQATGQEEGVPVGRTGVAGPSAGGTGGGPRSGVEDGGISRQEREAFAAAVPDILPEGVRAGNGLEHRAAAFLGMHDPDSVKDFAAALKTLRFEEAFVSQTALLRSRQEARKADTYACPNVGADSLRDRFIASLPFDLTRGQSEVIEAIGEDMSRDCPMQRLLQGEVGSGKTVVALAAMLQAVENGYQAVMVAPTQVLAEQHFESIGRMLSAMGGAGGADGAQGEADKAGTGSDKTPNINRSGPVPLVLLTGGMRLSERRRALAVGASGEPCIVIATHAAFSKTFQVPNLALAVIDEQHRFGVEQREVLRRKSDRSPHLLVMTATPIPRTAAMTWFGDLDISLLTELPGGRKPIRTVVIPESDASTMASMFLHLRRRVEAGERAYVVCPRIDQDDASGTAEGGGPGGPQGPAPRRRTGSRPPAGGGGGDVEEETLDLIDPYGDVSQEADGEGDRPPLHSVEEIRARLASLPQFDGIRLATLTGRDDDATKGRVMADFESGKTPVLVSTTVIEVGVDVPLATCIVIFDADRFGLSQLHQLRGRVGRGHRSSWAFLVSRAEPDSPAARRLDVIRRSNDGFEIAQADIEIRGAGDVLGDAQSGGRSSLKLLRVVKDSDMIARARDQAAALLEEDPGLKGEVELAGAALDFMRGNETFLTST